MQLRYLKCRICWVGRLIPFMLQKVFHDIKGFICLLICFRLQRPCYKISRWRRRKGSERGVGRRQVFIPISAVNFMNPVPNKGFRKHYTDPVHKYSLVYLYHRQNRGFLFVCRVNVIVFCKYSRRYYLAISNIYWEPP